MKTKLIVLLCVNFVVMGAFASGTSTQAASAKQLVMNAITEVFDNQRIELIDTYYHPKYIQHSPDIADGRQGLRDAVNWMKKNGVAPQREFVRVISDGNLVAMQSRVTIGGQSAIVADIFRIEDEMIIEHWDVQQQEVPVAQSANGNSMIDGGGDPNARVSSADMARNKQNVIDFVEKGFAGDKELLSSLFGDEYIQHNPMVPNGKDVVLGFLEGGGMKGNKVHQIVAEGDLTFALVEYSAFNNAAVDIFRHDANGKVVEHWDIVQKIPQKMAHDNGMF